VKKLKALIQATHSHTLIEIDGGVNFETGRELVAAGTNALVAGSFVFKSEDPEATIAGLKNLKTPEQVAKLRGKSVEELLG
jgi:ribulose-phosphate 3-epimerase